MSTSGTDVHLPTRETDIHVFLGGHLEKHPPSKPATTDGPRNDWLRLRPAAAGGSHTPAEGSVTGILPDV